MDTKRQAEQAKLDFQLERRSGKRLQESAKLEQQVTATRHANDLWQELEVSRDEGRTAAAGRCNIKLMQFFSQNERWKRLYDRSRAAEGRLRQAVLAAKSDDARLRFDLRAPAEVATISRVIEQIRGDEFLMANSAGLAFCLEQDILKSEEASAKLDRDPKETEEPRVRTGSVPPKPINPKLTTDDRLALLLKDTPESEYWNSRKLGELFNVDPSAIRQCKTWKAIQARQKGKKNERPKKRET